MKEIIKGESNQRKLENLVKRGVNPGVIINLITSGYKVEEVREAIANHLKYEHKRASDYEKLLKLCEEVGYFHWANQDPEIYSRRYPCDR